MKLSIVLSFAPLLSLGGAITNDSMSISNSTARNATTSSRSATRSPTFTIEIASARNATKVSISTAETSSFGIASYILHGLGIISSSTSSSSISSMRPSNVSGISTFSTLRKPNTTATLPNTAHSVLNQTLASSPSYRRPNGTNMTIPYPTATGILRNNSSNATLDRCWNQWNAFWDAGNMSTSVTTRFHTSTWTVTSTYTQTLSIHSAYTTTAVETQTVVQDVFDGDFDLGPQTYTSTITTTATYSLQTQASTQTVTTTEISSSRLIETVITDTSFLGPTPACVLPTSASQCQAAWDTWVSNNVQAIPTLPAGAPLFIPGTYTAPWLPDYNAAMTSWSQGIVSNKPSCTQAAIASSDCLSLADAYITGDNFMLLQSVAPPNARFFHSNGYYGVFGDFVVGGTPTFITSPQYFWPTSSTLALGCTVGCGRCAVTANSVQLLYWPPATETPSTGPMTMVTDGVTLTSPTLYVSYSEVYASDVCKGVGGTYTNTIVPIPDPAALSSVWGWPRPINNGQMLNPTSIVLATSSFNVADLYNTPVPMSIYTSQPWCATWAYINQQLSYGEGWANLTGWSCPSTRPYEPIIVIPSTVLAAMDPEWATCHGALQGAYDPPSALSPANNVASATLPIAGLATQTPSPNQASPTAMPIPSPPPSTGHSPSNGRPAPQTSRLPDSPPRPSPTPRPIATIASQPIILNPSPTGGLLIGDSTTLTPGLQTTINGTPLSVGTNTLLLGTQTLILTPPLLPAPQITLGALLQPLIPGPSPGLLILGSTTLSPGQVVTINGTPLSLAASSSLLVYGSSTFHYPGSTPSPQIQSLPNGGGFLIGTQTLLPGSPPITSAGTTFSALPDATGIVVASLGGTGTLPGAVVPVVTATGTAAAAAAAAATPVGTASEQEVEVPVTISGQAYTFTEVPGTEGVYEVDGTTFSVGGQDVTIDGEKVSAGSSGVVVGSSTARGTVTVVREGSEASLMATATATVSDYGVRTGIENVGSGSGSAAATTKKKSSGERIRGWKVGVWGVVSVLGFAMVL